MDMIGLADLVGGAVNPKPNNHDDDTGAGTAGIDDLLSGAELPPLATATTRHHHPQQLSSQCRGSALEGMKPWERAAAATGAVQRSRPRPSGWPQVSLGCLSKGGQRANGPTPGEPSGNIVVGPQHLIQKHRAQHVQQKEDVHTTGKAAARIAAIGTHSGSNTRMQTQQKSERPENSAPSLSPPAAAASVQQQHTMEQKDLERTSEDRHGAAQARMSQEEQKQVVDQKRNGPYDFITMLKTQLPEVRSHSIECFIVENT